MAAAIDDKLEQFGGAALTIRYEPHSVTPNIVIAELISSNGLKDEVMIQRFGSRWYLAIGYLPQPLGGPPTAQPAQAR